MPNKTLKEQPSLFTQVSMEVNKKKRWNMVKLSGSRLNEQELRLSIHFTGKFIQN